MSFQELRLEALAKLLREEANEILKGVRHARAAADQFDRAIESMQCDINEARGQATPQKKIYYYGFSARLRR
jgi:hypothetical protein